MRTQRGPGRLRGLFMALVMAFFLAGLWGCGGDGGLMLGTPVLQPPPSPDPPTSPAPLPP